MRVRYSAWTGRYEPGDAAPSAHDVLDEIADDVLDGADVSSAIARLLQRGFPGRAGLDELRRRMAAARAEELTRMGLDAPARALADELEPIVDRERDAVAAAGDDPRALDRAIELDALPDDAFGQVGALRGRPWFDPDAGRAFDELLDRLRREVADATFGDLAAALRGLDAETLAATREMLAELNDLAGRAERGEDVTDDYDAFRDRHRDALAGLGDGAPPETLDELLEAMARRMAALSALVAGLDDEQRRELDRLAAGALDDLGLQLETERLRATLRRRFAHLPWDRPPDGLPEAAPEGAPISGAVDWVERIARMEDLERSLGQRYPGARLEDIDVEAVSELLDEEAAADVRALRDVERVLEQAGAVRRDAGALELTARGLRRLGERALALVYGPARSGAAGAHTSTVVGGEGELSGTTRPLRFGDPFRLDVNRTVANAVRRRAGAGDAHGAAVSLAPDDFELAEAEQRVRMVTALLLDMSFSMPLRGNWGPAKRVALALEALIASRFPQDRLVTIGFSDYARRLGPRDLLASGWERVYGTNMEHAFALARREFEREPSAERQVIMITDGEPTAHLEHGRSVFSWPPVRATLERTLREGSRLQRAGATLNVFLLDHDPGAARFVEQLVQRVGGRLLYPDLRDLGPVVVRDFVSRRGGR